MYKNNYLQYILSIRFLVMHLKMGLVFFIPFRNCKENIQGVPRNITVGK